MHRVDLLRVFTCVVDMASFTRAARMLDMPRSSVSAAIRELEERLGARLLTRTTRSVTPTPDGEAFYAHAQRLVMDMEEAESCFGRGPRVCVACCASTCLPVWGGWWWPRLCRIFWPHTQPCRSRLA